MDEQRDVLFKGLCSAVGVLEDFQIIKNAAEYYESGVFSSSDKEEIMRLIDEKNSKEESGNGNVNESEDDSLTEINE